MYNLGLASRPETQPTFLEDLEHLRIARQHLGGQGRQPRLASNCHQMTHQYRPDAHTLILIDHGECHLGLPGLEDDVARAGRHYKSSRLLHSHHKGDVVDEINVREKVNFLISKVAPYAEEASIERFGTAASDGFEKFGPIVGCDGADFHLTSISEQFDRRIN